jgi:integrase
VFKNHPNRAGADLGRKPVCSVTFIHRLHPYLLWSLRQTGGGSLYVTLRDTGARVSEIAGLRVKDCNLEQQCLLISPTPWRTLKTSNSARSVPLSPAAVAALAKLTTAKDPDAPIFPNYAKERGGDSCSAMLMKRFRTVITDKKLTMHSLRHRMKDKLRNTGCPEAISLAILGHSTNTVAANYGSGYALDVMREALVKVWGE